MHKNTNFFESLKYAISGFIHAFRNERNLRFHIAAAGGVALFGIFYGLDRTEWTQLFIIFGMVISSELVNTAVENAVDTATREFDRHAKAAKDTAAGAVLISAVVALVAGLFIFSDLHKLIATVKLILSSPLYIFIFAAAAALDILFFVIGGRKADDLVDKGE